MIYNVLIYNYSEFVDFRQLMNINNQERHEIFVYAAMQIWAFEGLFYHESNPVIYVQINGDDFQIINKPENYLTFDEWKLFFTLNSENTANVAYKKKKGKKYARNNRPR